MPGMKSYFAAIQAPADEGNAFVPSVVNRYPVIEGSFPIGTGWPIHTVREAPELPLQAKTINCHIIFICVVYFFSFGATAPIEVMASSFTRFLDHT